MEKFSNLDKMRIQICCEQKLGYKKMLAKYRDRNWSLNSVKTMCSRFKQTGSLMERKPGSGRPKSARCNDNIGQVAELICSQEDEPGTSSSIREIAVEVGVGKSSVERIIKKDLGLRGYKRTPVQVLNEDAKRKRLERCRALLRRLTVAQSK